MVLFVAVIFCPQAQCAANPGAGNPAYTSEVAIAQAAAANQDYSTAFNDYLVASTMMPGDAAATSASLNILEQNTPDFLEISTIDAVQKMGLPYDITLQNTEVGTSNTDYKTVLLVPHDALVSEIDDPVETWPFSRVAYVYSSRDGAKAQLICTLHYQSRDYADLAGRIGTLLSVLDDVYTQRTQIERADDGYPFHVWLCSAAPVSSGGEQWRNNIYFYDVGDERSSIEWIREIAHEFSHLAFPAVGGSYTEPEAFANGYLGERLLVRWLDRGTAGGAPTVEAAWKGTFSGYPNFDRLLIAPALNLFSADGMSRTELAATDATGMRYLIGMMLHTDDVCGSAAVGTILQGLADQHSTDPNLLYIPVKQALAAHPKAAK